MDARDFRGIGRPAQEELRRRALFLIEHEGMTQAQAARAVAPPPDGERLAAALPRAGRGRPPRRPAGVARARPGAADRGRGPAGPGLDRRGDARPAGAAVRAVDLARGARAGRAAAGEAARAVDGAALPAALGPDPAEAAGAGQGALAGRGHGLAGAGLPGDRQAGQGGEGRDLLGGRDRPLQPGPGRALLGAPGRDPGGRADGEAGDAEPDRGGQQPRADALHALRGALNADLFLDFLRRLVRDAGRKVVLIVDNLKVHKAGRVRAWLESHRHEIELVYLPSYAPDHNPVEHLNNDLKQQLRQQPQPDSKDELIRNARSVLRGIQRSPERVRAYFRPEPVRYAAWGVRDILRRLVMPVRDRRRGQTVAGAGPVPACADRPQAVRNYTISKYCAVDLCRGRC